MRSYPVKENPIGSAVTEILRYKHTNTQTNILFLKYKDILSFRSPDLGNEGGGDNGCPLVKLKILP